MKIDAQKTLMVLFIAFCSCDAFFLPSGGKKKGNGISGHGLNSLIRYGKCQTDHRWIQNRKK